MKFTRTLTALALVMGLGAAPALAQEEAALDADEDGEITEEEWTTFGDESFADADADQGGYVDEEEYNTWATSNFGGEPGGGDDDGALFGLFDTNDDVQVDEDEWFGEDAYGELDDDDSGALDEDEFGVAG